MKTMFPLVKPTPFKSTFSLGLLALSIAQILDAGQPSPPTPPAIIANISSRVETAKKDRVSLTEFSVQGPTTKYVILRALGPSLRAVGIDDAILDPVLTLLDAQGNVLAFNDNWVDSPDRDAIIATGIPPTNKRESAIVYTLDPGIYVAAVKDLQNRYGTSLAEVYDLQSSNDDYFSAIGIRADARTDDGVIISGSVILGNGPISILIRALGPSLITAGVSHALEDPVLELHDSFGNLIATNDNWMDSPNRDEIIATGLAPTDDRESALLLTLAPGDYTAVVYGVNNTTGIAFLQSYSLAIPGPELIPNPIVHR